MHKSSEWPPRRAPEFLLGIIAMCADARGPPAQRDYGERVVFTRLSAKPDQRGIPQGIFASNGGKQNRKPIPARLSNRLRRKCLSTIGPPTKTGRRTRSSISVQRTDLPCVELATLTDNSRFRRARFKRSKRCDCVVGLVDLTQQTGTSRGYDVIKIARRSSVLRGSNQRPTGPCRLGIVFFYQYLGDSSDETEANPGGWFLNNYDSARVTRIDTGGRGSPKSRFPYPNRSRAHGRRYVCRIVRPKESRIVGFVLEIQTVRDDPRSIPRLPLPIGDEPNLLRFEKCLGFRQTMRGTGFGDTATRIRRPFARGLSLTFSLAN